MMAELLVLARQPCEWCSAYYRTVPATVQTATVLGGATARLCDNCADKIGEGPRTALVIAADLAVPTRAEVAAHLEAQKWTFARSVPDQPHEYTVHSRSTDPWMHMRVLAHIRANGERRQWPVTKTWHTYLQVGEYLYWTMAKDTDLIVNRKRAEPL
jgi:hypothetical protein